MSNTLFTHAIRHVPVKKPLWNWPIRAGAREAGDVGREAGVSQDTQETQEEEEAKGKADGRTARLGGLGSLARLFQLLGGFRSQSLKNARNAAWPFAACLALCMAAPAKQVLQ